MFSESKNKFPPAEKFSACFARPAQNSETAPDFKTAEKFDDGEFYQNAYLLKIILITSLSHYLYLYFVQ